MGNTNPKVESAKAEQVLDADFGRFDLRTPPSRTEAGVPEGLDSAFYERDRDDPFRVEVRLPEDRRLDVETDLVIFHGPLVVGGPSTEPPFSMDIQRHGLDPDDARDRLLGFAGQFGLDASAIREWHSEISGDSADGRPDTGWLQTKIGYVSFAMQGRYDRLVDEAVVAIRLSWHNLPTVSPSVSPPRLA